MTLATMMAHISIFENTSLKDGDLLPLTFDLLRPARISCSSDLLIVRLSIGSLSTFNSHTESHKQPSDAKKANVPVRPICDMMIGVARKLTTFPRWNPPMERPTAVARSCVGNHLFHVQK